MRKVVILGSGPAGLTAAIYTARAGLHPLVIEGDTPGGQLTTTTMVENFPGFPKGILGPELMANMREQARYFGAEFKRGRVTAVDFDDRPFTITLDGTERLGAEAVIIATGASPKLLGIPGEREWIGRGVSTCATCDGFFFTGKHVIVVGGGDAAMEEALFLTRFAETVTVVHRRHKLRASQIMQERAQEHPKIRWVLNATPVAVEADVRFRGLRVRDNDTGDERVIAADGLFVAIGHRPNTDFLIGQLPLKENGYIETIPGTTRTRIAGVFACGDVQDDTYRQAITAAGSGCMAALDCERFLHGLDLPSVPVSSPAPSAPVAEPEPPKPHLPPRRCRKLIAVHSMAPSVGKSQIALNLAAQYRQNGYERVLFLELDYLGSTVSPIAYEGRSTLMNWLEHPLDEVPDWETVNQRLTARVPEVELHVIPLPDSYSRVDAIPLARIQWLLDVLETHFDVIVVELGIRLTEENRHILERADRVWEIAQPLERHAETLRHLAQTLQQQGIRRDHFRVVLNKDRGGLELQRLPEHIRTQFPWPIALILPLEDSVRFAASEGKLVSQSHPFSEFAAGMKRLTLLH